jgi:DNA-binding beta-propeller fold protein YncE
MNTLRGGNVRTCITTLFFLSIFLLSGGGEAQAPRTSIGGLGPLVLEATIPLPDAKGRMDHMGLDRKGRRVFLAEIGNGGVEAIDITNGKRLHMLTGFGEPQGIFFDPATYRLFVASGDDGTVKIFDGSSYALVTTARFSSDADNLRWDGGTNRVMVGYGGQKFVGGRPVERPGVRSTGDGALAYVDSSGKKSPGIPVDAHPESFQLEKNGTRVFVNVPDRHEIEVGDLAKKAVIAHWPVPCTDNFPMALDEAHHRLFIGCRIPPKMLVFNTDTGKKVASLDIPGTTDDLFYDAARGRIYVLGGEGDVDVFAQKDADHYERIARVGVPVGSRTGLFVPEMDKLFVAVSQSPRQHPELLVFEVR